VSAGVVGEMGQRPRRFRCRAAGERESLQEGQRPEKFDEAKKLQKPSGIGESLQVHAVSGNEVPWQNSREEESTMRRIMLSLVLVALMIGFGGMAFGQAEPDVAQHPSCKYCGMDRHQYSHSRMLIEYEDGSSFGACSMHCAAVDMALNIDKTPKAFKVGDYNSKKLVDAEKAVWVIGGNKPGVMTKRAKWAFGDKKDAEAFIKENGGVLASFDDALKASYEDMYSDTKMINEKRKAKRAQQQKSQ
jgi:copper chaperone NosL